MRFMSCPLTRSTDEGRIAVVWHCGRNLFNRFCVFRSECSMLRGFRQRDFVNRTGRPHELQPKGPPRSRWCSRLAQIGEGRCGMRAPRALYWSDIVGQSCTCSIRRTARTDARVPGHRDVGVATRGRRRSADAAPEFRALRRGDGAGSTPLRTWNRICLAIGSMTARRIAADVIGRARWATSTGITRSETCIDSGPIAGRYAWPRTSAVRTASPGVLMIGRCTSARASRT